MIRKAFVMAVHPGHEAEYERRHRPIPEELARTLAAHGVRNYSIFLDEGSGALFGYAEIESEERWSAIGETEACRRWWKAMSELMPTHPDASPQSRDLREVFHQD